MLNTDLGKAFLAEAAESALYLFSQTRPANPPDTKLYSRLQHDGIVVIPGFYPRQVAESLRAEIDRVLECHKSAVWTDSQNSDMRLFGADRVSDILNKHLHDPRIDLMGQHYTRSPLRARMAVAARMTYQPGNLGSGAGWHRDSPVRRQFKALLYLSDVTESHGPFEYLAGTHAKNSVFQFVSHGLQTYRQYRFTDAEVERILSEGGVKKLKILGSAGDLVLVNTKGIHRGAPIQMGERYALTNYYFEKSIPEHMANFLVNPS